jgi:hypothetical protein
MDDNSTMQSSAAQCSALVRTLIRRRSTLPNGPSTPMATWPNASTTSVERDTNRFARVERDETHVLDVTLDLGTRTSWSSAVRASSFRRGLKGSESTGRWLSLSS